MRRGPRRGVWRSCSSLSEPCPTSLPHISAVPFTSVGGLELSASCAIAIAGLTCQALLSFHYGMLSGTTTGMGLARPCSYSASFCCCLGGLGTRTVAMADDALASFSSSALPRSSRFLLLFVLVLVLPVAAAASTRMAPELPTLPANRIVAFDLCDMPSLRDGTCLFAPFRCTG